MPITFVPEYCSHVKDFRKNPDPVGVLDLSKCHLLEINNRDDAKNRTILSLNHFTVAQLATENLDILRSNLTSILHEFAKNGGDIKSAQIRIYGGAGYQDNCQKSRDNLVANLMALTGRAISTIEHPKGHHMEHDKQSTDYLFRQNSITFRQADLRYDMKEYKDVFSVDLQTLDKKPDTAKIEEYQLYMDQQKAEFDKISDDLIDTMSKRHLNINIARARFDYSTYNNLIKMKLIDANGREIAREDLDSAPSSSSRTSRFAPT